MNRLGTVFVLVSFGAFALFACSGNRCKTECPQPAWVNTPPVLGAMGYNKGINPGLARDLAEDNARAKIAKAISVKMSGLLEESYQQVAGPESELTGHQYFEGIKQTIYNQSLSGARVVQYFEDCCTDGIYALVTLEEESLMAMANEQAKAAAKVLLSNAEEKHEELSKKFSKAMKKAYGE